MNRSLSVTQNMQFTEILKGSSATKGLWNFHLDTAFNGAFGGANGGLLAAMCVHAARDLAPDRIVSGIDTRFIRSFRPGQATVRTKMINHGRALSTVRVEILTSESKVATIALVSLIASESLADINLPALPPPADGFKKFSEGKIWPQPPGSHNIPLIDTFGPRYLGRSDRGIATAVDVIWAEATLSAESICIAADISVGPPVMRALKGKMVPTPNPDISLRFTGADDAKGHLVSHCQLMTIHSGLATTTLQVYGGDTLVATGTSTTTCLGNPRP